MGVLEHDEYTKRIDDQIFLHDKNANKLNHAYTRVTLMILVLTLTILLVSVITAVYFRNNAIPQIITAIIAAIICVLEVFVHFKQYDKLCILYRKTSELLSHERAVYLAKATPYNNVDVFLNFELFVERCESILSNNNDTWTALYASTKN